MTSACAPPPRHLPGSLLSQLAAARQISDHRPPARRLPCSPWRPPPALPPGRDAQAAALPPRAARPLTCGGRPAGRGRGGAGQQQGEPPGQPILAGPRERRAGGAGGGSGRRAPELPPAPPRPRHTLLPPALFPSLLPRSNPHLPPAPAPRPPPLPLLSSSLSSLPTFCESRSWKLRGRAQRR